MEGYVDVKEAGPGDSWERHKIVDMLTDRAAGGEYLLHLFVRRTMV